MHRSHSRHTERGTKNISRIDKMLRALGYGFKHPARNKLLKKMRNKKRRQYQGVPSI